MFYTFLCKPISGQDISFSLQSYWQVQMSSETKFNYLLKCRNSCLFDVILNFGNIGFCCANFVREFLLSQAFFKSCLLKHYSDFKTFVTSFQFVSFFCSTLAVVFFFKIFDLYSAFILSAISISFLGVFCVFFWNPFAKTTNCPLSKKQKIRKISLPNWTLI